MKPSRLGYWSSLGIVAIGVAYMVVLAVGMIRHGLSEPIVDPVLAIMEGLTIVSAAPIVLLLAAVRSGAAGRRRVRATIALAFGILFALTTTAVHVHELTIGRETGVNGLVWPSRVYALELLAWDLFLGLALVLAAASFERDRTTRYWMAGCGLLCLIGIVGPAVGNMRWQLIGVAGYAVVLPVVAVLMARRFAREGRPAG